jgi:alpha-ketoglutarate-dependent taurine dioxygenase
MTKQLGTAARLAPRFVKPKPVSTVQPELVKASFLEQGHSLPLVIQPLISDMQLNVWAAEHRDLIEDHLLKCGAVLFRGFRVETVADFEQVVSAISGEPLKYTERSSPRHEVGDRIYTSTDYPPEQSIFLHNEHSYSRTFPLKLFFCCMVPAQKGGETPIADCRKILQRISPDVRRRFEEKKWIYQRNLDNRFGLAWQTVVQTTDKTAVETYCRQSQIDFKWKGPDWLCTSQVRPVTAIHPKSGEVVWFNHATFFHVTTLNSELSETLLSDLNEDDLPNNTYYGDGSPIEPAVMDHLRAAYIQETVSLSWQRGDILLLDNMLTAHSRSSFVGPRKVVVAMADPHTRSDF